MKKRWIWNKKRFLENLIGLIGFVITLWATISWVEVILKNLVNPTYSSWNFWYLIFGR